MFPYVLADDDDFGGTSSGQALAKWLHNPRKDGQQKQLHCWQLTAASTNFAWVVINFKKVFLRARTSVSYTVNFTFSVTMPIEPFELVNEWTNEKLTWKKKPGPSHYYCWLLKRCPNIIVGETAEAVQKQQQKDANLTDFFHLRGFNNSIGPLVSSRKQKVTKKGSRHTRRQAVSSSSEMNE